MGTSKRLQKQVILDDEMKNLLLKEYKKEKNKNFIISVGVDILGFSSYGLPLLGEIGDIVFAPISMIANIMMNVDKDKKWYRSKKGWLTLVEEGMPFTDIIPSVTLSWRNKYQVNEKETFRKFIEEKTMQESAFLDVFSDF